MRNNDSLKGGGIAVIWRFCRTDEHGTHLINSLTRVHVRPSFRCSHALAIHMQDLDKQLVFYCNILGYVLFVLIISYFYLTSKPKDAI